MQKGFKKAIKIRREERPLDCDEKIQSTRSNTMIYN